jgi:hypothetical protein
MSNDAICLMFMVGCFTVYKIARLFVGRSRRK